MHYVKTDTLRHASDLLIQETGVARILAGGTDVLVQNSLELVEPDIVINIKFIEGIRAIDEEEAGYRIGAAGSGAELGEHPGVRALWPGVVEAMEPIGSMQVQGRATLVGNLCNVSLLQTVFSRWWRRWRRHVCLARMAFGIVPFPPLAAVSNAVFRAAGVRMRNLPMSPAKVLAAISKGLG